jgi:undecaprenyl-diphosphatase
MRHLLRRYPRFASFLGRRLSRDEYLGLHLTVGLLLCVALLGLFAIVARNVVLGTSLTRLDTAIGLRLQEHRLEHPVLKRLFWVVTQLGDTVALTVLGVVVALYLLRRHQRLLALVWLAALLGGALLDQGLKVAFGRERPSFRDALIHETTKSFPSGHSFSSMVAYGFLAYLLFLTLPRRWALTAAVGLAALIALIGFSRMYLGAHYFSDVLGGFAVGACWLAACVSGVETVRRRRRVLRQHPSEPEA